MLRIVSCSIAKFVTLEIINRNQVEMRVLLHKPVTFRLVHKHTNSFHELMVQPGTTPMYSV